MFCLFNIEQIDNSEIICFGAGGSGRNLLNNWDVNFMEYNIVAFVDNNPQLCGSRIYGGNTYLS